jgi:energy-coupling factor transport system substrate-specific component
MIRLIQVPIQATGGYTQPGAVAEIFVALAFGPVLGAVAAAVGAALADLTSGFGSFAPLTFVAHGALGLLAGWLGWGRGWPGAIAGWVAGGLALVAIYFLGEATLYGFGMAGAVAEAPINLFQVALGFVGLLLYQAVKRAYPQLMLLGRRPTFKEEE